MQSKNIFIVAIALLFAITGCKSVQHTTAKSTRKIVLIAGEKSHGPGEHEYIKTVRLIKTMLDKSNIKGITTEVYLHGWPDKEATFNDAALIVFVSDGPDGYNFPDAPFMTAERTQILKKQMDRGCGLALLHFSTFSTHAYSENMLNWAGGYFDWQLPNGERHKYSDLKIIEADVQLTSPKHPISSGVKPFHITEEFYYNMRFRDNDMRLTPILSVPALGGRPNNGNTVAWALQRPDGGRSFNTTINHFYNNWQNADYRKIILNGLVWAANAEVPINGVEAPFYTDAEVDEYMKNCW